MKPDVKTKWVEALRSGDYEQGDAALRKSDSRFCCLGVLCDIVAPEGWTKTSIGWTHAHELGYPNDGVLVASGLEYDKSRFLSRMNDAYGNTFNEIADYIEENL